jgi:hypothetical protein
MNKTADQLQSRYHGKLLWITMQSGAVHIGQLAGKVGRLSPPLTGPENLLIWPVEDLSAYFSDRGSLSEGNHFRIQPSDIIDISVLDWNETGAAQALYERCANRYVKIKTKSNVPIDGVIINSFIPGGLHSPIEEGIRVLPIQSEQNYINYMAGTPGRPPINDVPSIPLNEITMVKVLRNPPK